MYQTRTHTGMRTVTHEPVYVGSIHIAKIKLPLTRQPDWYLLSKGRLHFSWTVLTFLVSAPHNIQ